MKFEGMDHVKLVVGEKLSVETITDLVASPTCGAVSVFIGTTRDNFEDKNVLHLEYEAYEDMAAKALRKICGDIRRSWPSVENIAIYHRLGCVPVKEASIVIAISSPHRADAMSATQWCIDNVKKSVPIWKKEIYAGEEDAPQWKENKECTWSKNSNAPFPIRVRTKYEVDGKQDMKVPYVSPHLIQVKATHAEIENRINRFMERKRAEIDRCNVRDFCRRDPDATEQGEDSCARVTSVLIKRKDSKGHLRVNRVYNGYCYRDQQDADYLTKYIPQNGVEERMQSLESQLSLTSPAPKDVYVRLKALEDRLLHLESISPEYVQFWVQENLSCKPAKKKKIFSLHEIDGYISELETRKANKFVRR